jgi:hypothetical protein
LLAHLAELVLHACPDAAQVDRGHAVEVLGRFIGRIGRGNLDAGVVEGHVESAEGGDGAFHHGGDLGFVRDVAVMPMAWCPAAVSSSAAADTDSGLTSASTTAAPASAKAWAVVSPMPDPAPVTSAT